MNLISKQTESIQQPQKMQRYYRFQSRIYDLTRWSFLFGRRAILKKLPFSKIATPKIIEVGCGTGYNLKQLAEQLPKAQLMGYDVSSDMLSIAKQKTKHFPSIQLREQAYGNALASPSPASADLVLFSYSLSMINPQWPELVQQAVQDLQPGGHIAVVDFHQTRFSWFRKHMSNHHVRMEGQLLPVLQQHFQDIDVSVRKAYLGLWEYVIFVGKKK